MSSSRYQLGRSLRSAGAVVIAVGVVLILVKIGMILAWQGGWILLAGLILFGVGWLLGKR